MKLFRGIKKVVENFWVQLLFMLITIFETYKMYADSIMKYLVANTSWLLAATITSFICGSFLACIHAYFDFKRTRRDLIILEARLDGQFTKIDSQFEAVSEGFKAFNKSISDAAALISKNQEDFNQRFEWLYQQIQKKQIPVTTVPTRPDKASAG